MVSRVVFKFFSRGERVPALAAHEGFLLRVFDSYVIVEADFLREGFIAFRTDEGA